MSSYKLGPYIRTKSADIVILPEMTLMKRLTLTKLPYEPSQHTRNTVDSGLKLRKALVEAMRARHASQIEQAALAYLPHCHSISNSLVNKPELSEYTDVSIEWFSGIVDPDKKPDDCYTKSKSYCFEFVMVEYVIAYANTCLAHHFSSKYPGAKVFSEDFKVAVKHYRIAAGIFEYIASVELPRFYLIPEQRIPEMSPTIANALASFCLAEAQAISILKARSSSSSPSVLSRICLDARNKFAATKTMIESASSVSSYVCKELKTYLKFYMDFYFGLALKYTAEVHYNAKKYGLAVGTALLAVGTFKGLDTKSYPEYGFKQVYEKEYPGVKEQHAKYTSENDSAFFEEV
eukprot:TRINITY_DN4695_c0_g1_i3.p1 TRINITY_DN4695_c0_g1~~TRINITY_DN4695_c0_g1_i3.p1  ORF type:complete len:348 (+),score=55.25 TRINITY_DN4695_c0_g1_i3:58-1101(+)